MTSNPYAAIHHGLIKVPAVTLVFWIIKILSTTVGETGADLIIFKLQYGLANTTYLMTALLAVSLLGQIKSKRYIPWLYWLAVVLLSIVGTLITDNLTDNLGVSLEISTVTFSLALLSVFVAWCKIENTLSINSINTRTREFFYWLAILLTFALGTAAGDLFSENWNLGYLKSGFIFCALIIAVVIAHRVFKMNSVLTFWLAYILTRPMGASLGDYLSQSKAHGGLGFGTVKQYCFSGRDPLSRLLSEPTQQHNQHLDAMNKFNCPRCHSSCLS